MYYVVGVLSHIGGRLSRNNIRYAQQIRSSPFLARCHRILVPFNMGGRSEATRIPYHTMPGTYRTARGVTNQGVNPAQDILARYRSSIKKAGYTALMVEAMMA